MPPVELVELTPQHPVRYVDGDVEFVSHPDGTELVNLSGPGDSFLAALELDFEDAGFGANLAQYMSASQRYGLAQRLCEYARTDLESRKHWEDMTETALRLLGIEKIDASNLPFPGAAAVQHPVLAEACVQFQANAIQEFFPATGPVKGEHAGEATEESEARVRRAESFMNFYLTTEDPGYYADTDQMLFYLPIAGSVFRKGWTDPRNGLPRSRYVKAEDFIVPYTARDLENCSRYAHRYTMTGSEIRRAMARGEFIDVDLPRPPPIENEENSGQRLEDAADRRQRVVHEDDEIYEIYEYHIEISLPEGVDELDDGRFELPYIITVDATTQEILSIRRNWREDDPERRKRIWFTHYKFLPGLGFYGWGFLHVIGSLCEAVSGSVRALLDSALMATLQGGFRAKDGAKSGSSIQIEPGKWKDVDATYEELQKTFYTPPFREPSPALHQLFVSLVQDARRFASLTEVLVGQADNKAPVGTTIALIEQSMKLFSAIHKRIFAAAREEFRILAELFFEFAPYDEYPYHVAGEAKYALREDFDPRTVDFIPVADPNIVSDVQRISISQAVLEIIKAFPHLFGVEEQVEAVRRFLQALRVPDFERIAPRVPTPIRIDPIGENARAMIGQQIRAFPGQQHELHKAAHWRQIEIARNTLPADQFEQVYTILMSHIREHEALQMLELVSSQMQQSTGVPLPPIDIYRADESLPPDVEMALTIAAAQNLPPVPPPHPMSVGAQQAAESDQAAKDAEAQAKIERETAAFVARLKQQEHEHAQRLRHREEEHRAKLRQLAESTAAQIVRQSADAQARRRQDMARGRTKLALEVARERESARARTEAEKKRVRKSTRRGGGGGQ